MHKTEEEYNAANNLIDTVQVSWASTDSREALDGNEQSHI